MATKLVAPPSRRSIPATRPLWAWRTVDILTIAFLGAAFGVAFWGWGVFYNGPVTALKIGYAPLMGLFAGPWFLAGVVGGLVVRRPGAALFCEVVAALVSMLPGTEWGATVLVSGILQGLGAELAQKGHVRILVRAEILDLELAQKGGDRLVRFVFLVDRDDPELAVYVVRLRQPV